MKVTFTPTGFNPHTEKVTFVATVHGANGQANFDYSGGILAFIPRTRKFKQLAPPFAECEGPFDLWTTLDREFRRQSGWHTTNVQSVLRAVRRGQMKALPNWGNAMVRAVFTAIAAQARPKENDCLACLMMDASAENASFVEWCSEFGYDDDSREAERIWQACRENAHKLRKILSREEWEAAEKIAQDY